MLTTAPPSASESVGNVKVKYLLFFIFVVSGFAGLIYESIWSHYLKLFLGHALMPKRWFL